jgi:FkbM family methyltransferase
MGDSSNMPAELWQRFHGIGPFIRLMYEAPSRPFQKYAERMITRFPRQNFYFRPCFLNEFLMALNIWELSVFQQMSLRKGDVFVDLGANVGYYTRKAAQKVGAQGLVIAVEPDRRTLQVLHLNVAEFKNVKVFEKAIGADGYLYINTARDPTMTRTAKTGKLRNRIPSISLNTLLGVVGKRGTHRVFVKIDVEGAELDVIKNAASFINELQPRFLIETDQPQEIMMYLEPFEYEYRELFKENFFFTPRQ